MKVQFFLSSVLLGLAVVPEAAAQCAAKDWFNLADVEVHCPLGDSKTVTVLIPFAESYIAAEPPDEGSDDLNIARFEAIKRKQDKISLTLQPLSGDLKREVIEEFALTRLGFAADFPAFPEGKGIGSFRLVFPAGTLSCKDQPIDQETVVEIQPPSDDAVVNCAASDEASRPLDWRVDLAPADDDAEDDAGVTVEFEIEKDWGYNFKLDRVRQRWSTNVWRLQVDGSGATNDTDFYDSVKADLSWSYSRAYVADALRTQPFTAWWGSAYVRPETTFDEDDWDYVYGARLEVIANLRKLIGTDIGVGTRPYLALGIEQVDPSQREDGAVPDNYERLTGDFLWKFSPLERVRVEAGWEAKYILSKDDLAALELDDQHQDKLEISIAYDATGNGEFLPFLKYTRGTESPGFELVDEVLFGFAWSYLFEGERP